MSGVNAVDTLTARAANELRASAAHDREQASRLSLEAARKERLAAEIDRARAEACALLLSRPWEVRS